MKPVPPVDALVVSVFVGVCVPYVGRDAIDQLIYFDEL